jgi:hypothetical protein
MNQYFDQTALTIGYVLMTVGGILLVSFITWLILVVIYKMMTYVANALTKRFINLHGLNNVRAVYRKQEQNHDTNNSI